MTENRFQILQTMLKKKFKNKEVSISSGDEAMSRVVVNDFIDSGSVKMNLDLGGGYARGRIIEIYGPEGSSKSTLALTAIKTEQAKGNKCAYIDAEHALNKEYMVNLGIDFNNLLLIQTQTAEQAWSAVEMLVQSGEVSFIVLDSLAALVPEAVWDKGIDGDTMARLAALNTKAITMINPVLSKTNTTLLLVNQIRQGLDMFGPKETTPGGNVIKFFASQRIRVKRKAVENDSNGIPVVQITEYQIVKNKISSPGRQGTYRLIYGKGIDIGADIVDTALLDPNSELELAGSWIKYEGKTICQGKDNFIQMVLEDPALLGSLKNKLMRGANEITE